MQMFLAFVLSWTRSSLYLMQTRLMLILKKPRRLVLWSLIKLLLWRNVFLNKKAKINWLKEGNSNSAYFHKTVKSHVSRSRIDTTTNAEGLVFVNEAVSNIFVSHYEMFLGLDGETQGFNDSNLFKTCLNEQVATNMVRNVTPQEVKEALFSMGDDKSLGPDGYTACFFKAAWEVGWVDVTNVICEFFQEWNCSKNLTTLLLPLFQALINSTFILGSSITDNILLTQELMHNYHLDRGTPRCAFKVDIQKAYDTVDWEFLRRILHGFGFHARMIAWIMECVTNTSYFICVNGSLHGYFRGKRGLHQGDPLSPYLFTLVMEVLTLMLQRRVHESQVFTYHRFCSKLELVNLCFADDLFLFAYGDVHSASMIKEALEEFKGADCVELIDRVQTRIQDWKNKSLSTAGRLQLIRSVLGAMHTYWASVFILPFRVLLNIEQLMRGFLWSPSSLKKGPSKVAWEVVCLPKNEGGLGIRRLEVFNSALMIAHIWKLLSLKESLWVKWIHEYILKGRSFWDIPLCGNVSWGWRKILQLRPTIREFIWCNLGDGAATSLWFDKWCEMGPLANLISSRDIFRAGLSHTSKVRDIIQDGAWNWPQDLLSKYPFLSTYGSIFILDALKLIGIIWFGLLLVYLGMLLTFGLLLREN
ncbi:hypothetical protein Tco_1046345 [Tanacetum coccineum]